MAYPDYIIIDWDEGTFIFIIEGKYYEYNIDEEHGLLAWGLGRGTAFEEL